MILTKKKTEPSFPGPQDEIFSDFLARNWNEVPKVRQKLKWFNWKI